MTTAPNELERAWALYELGRYDEAVTRLTALLTEDPDHTRAWGALARAHLKRYRYKEALEASDQALRCDPEYVDALLVRSEAVRQTGGGIAAAEETLREAVRVAPQFWGGYAMLADIVFRRDLLRCAHEAGTNELTPEIKAAVPAEGADLAREAIRLGPEEVYAYEVALFIAQMSGAEEDSDQFERAILRLDPTHPGALSRQTAKAARAEESLARRATDLYADALSVAPDNAALRGGLDKATFRLLRGTRWLAIACVLAAGVTVDLFATADDPVQRELPLPLGQRIWLLCIMALIWGFGAWRVYRRLRTGARLNVRSLIRRDRWARVVVGQASFTTLCALLIGQVPWTDRTWPQVLFWSGLVVPWLTISYDRRRTE
ncbi:tetratricopeptide repeat protein [Streptomyces californicus]|uniref:tetratricopeptide repeat protein n=1 Tax=Streptomyces californicus TaxID=67351 RepID=UPI0033E47E77